MQAEIVEDARIVGPRRQRPLQRLERRLRDRAAGLQGQALAQRRQRLGVVGVLRQAGARLGQQAGDVDLARRGGMFGSPVREGRGGQAGAAGLQVEA